MRPITGANDQELGGVRLRDPDQCINWFANADLLADRACLAGLVRHVLADGV
jgi:hypothetical protein